MREITKATGIVLVIAHGGRSGDYFHDYVAMRKGEDGLWRRVGEFGAYVFGESLGKMPDREFHLMMAGEPVSFDFEGAAERKRK